MSSKNQSRSFGLAIRNNNVRAAIAVVSMDAQTLSHLNFQPHLVLTMISKNDECVTWFVNFLRGLPEGRRDAIFRCTYKNKKSIILLRDAGIPRHWLSSGEFTPKQHMWMINIGYTDMSPRESDSDKSEEDVASLDGSYVEKSVPNVHDDFLHRFLTYAPNQLAMSRRLRLRARSQGLICSAKH
jgi:hypothetical protein